MSVDRGLYYPDGRFKSKDEICKSNSHPDKKKCRISFEDTQEIIDRARQLAKDFDIGQREATWVIETEKPVAIALITDAHFGSLMANSKLFREHLDFIDTTPRLFCVTNGDDVDNFNATGKWASGMMEDPLPPQIVSRSVCQKLKKLDDKSKIGAMGFGNHNDFGYNGGQDWYDTFLGSFRCPILTSGGIVHTYVNGQRYDIAMTHKYWGTSKLNPTNACKRFMDFEYPEADIALLGHTHQSEGLHFEKGGKDRIAVIGGTYKDEDVFARKGGIGGRSGSPGWAVVLWPNERKMELLKDIGNVRNFIR